MPRQKRSGPSAEPVLLGSPQGQSGDERTLLVRAHLRSGQHVRYAGNVVVLGDVNPGAEIRADGDIIVMGTLRGLAHAGAGGNLRAQVAAFRLEATQLRIGEYVARAPEGAGGVPPGVPEVAVVRDGQVTIDSYRFRVPSPAAGWTTGAEDA